MRCAILLAAALSVVLAGTAGCGAVPASAVRIDVVAVAGSLSSSELDGLLPLSLSLSDSMGSAQIADLPHPLNDLGLPAVEGYEAGDVLYWSAEKRIVIPTSDGAALPEGGLVLLGRVAKDLDPLVDCTSSCRVQLVAEGETK